MSGRLRLCQTIANAIKGLGYEKDLGYHQFLYSNDADMRALFMWLVERLPKQAAEDSQEPMDAATVLRRLAAAELSRRTALPWLMPACVRDGLRRVDPRTVYVEGARGLHLLRTVLVRAPSVAGEMARRTLKAVMLYYTVYLPPITAQAPSRRSAIASIADANACAVAQLRAWDDEWNRRGLQSGLSQSEYRLRKRRAIQARMAECVGTGSRGRLPMLPLDALLASFRARGAKPRKGTRFAHAAKLQFAQDDAPLPTVGSLDSLADREAEMKRRQDEELAALQARLDALQTQIEQLNAAIAGFLSEIAQMEAELHDQEAVTPAKEDAYLMRKRVLDLLPEAAKNLAQLQAMIAASVQRLAELAAQWERYRAPLVEEYRKLRVAQQERLGESLKQLEQIKAIREQIRALGEEARARDELYRQLCEEYAAMNKTIMRSAYTRRIGEIINNIKKQKADIDRVLIDTRSVQKEVNALTEKVKRIFALADEAIFSEARKGPASKHEEFAREAFKQLTAMHETFGSLTTTVDETGKLLNEIREIEEKIENLKLQKVEENTQRIAADYEAIRRENDALAAADGAA